jgi:serine/threonine protein kinase
VSLGVGARLGHYAVTAKLGEGGMGEVWRATDTQLNRDVALKILPEAFATDPDRLARFQREAQVLASLNHPGIAAIYGIEEDEGTRALVLELVVGVHQAASNLALFSAIHFSLSFSISSLLLPEPLMTSS